MYWTTLLRYDHEAQIKDRRRSVESTFTSDQLTTARDLFASCSPHADERALASRDATPNRPTTPLYLLLMTTRQHHHQAPTESKP